jgi:hypothetical protein
VPACVRACAVVGVLGDHGDFPIETVVLRESNDKLSVDLCASASHDATVKFWNLDEMIDLSDSEEDDDSDDSDDSDEDSEAERAIAAAAAAAEEGAAAAAEPAQKKRKMTKGVKDAKSYESKKDSFYDDL